MQMAGRVIMTRLAETAPFGGIQVEAVFCRLDAIGRSVYPSFCFVTQRFLCSHLLLVKVAQNEHQTH